MTAVQLSSQAAAADTQYDGLRDLLTTQWQTLSPTRARMVGEPFKLNDRERDEIRWNCGAGPGLRPERHHLRRPDAGAARSLRGQDGRQAAGQAGEGEKARPLPPRPRARRRQARRDREGRRRRAARDDRCPRRAYDRALATCRGPRRRAG